MPLALSPDVEVTLTAEKPVAGGRMLARHDGQVVFVAGAIPGERVRARVERVSRQLAYAETVDVLERSADRRDAAVDSACGGSLYAHITYPRQLALKSELVTDAFARIGKLRLPSPVPVLASAEHGYRMRARLHIRDGRIGFFREGTHDLCDPGPTHQLLPETIVALEQLEAELKSSGARAVSCEVSENIPASERGILVERADGHSEIHGAAAVTDRIQIGSALMTLTRHVRSFFQGNRWLVPQLAARVIAQVPEGAVVDLYAGVGLFAIALAAAGHGSITAIEGDRSSADDLAANAAPYGGSIVARQSSVEEYVEQRHARVAQTFVVDPPRTGISREAMSGVAALKPRRIVYISCDVATLARDVKRLVEAGYRLDHIEAFDLFPNTAHVETLAVLVR